MIFQHTIENVLNGTKAQTSRIVKPGEYAAGTEIGVISAVATHNKQALKWQVGNTYAVQPGRGQKAVARIRILQIRQMDVREWDRYTAEPEKCGGLVGFWELWCTMHDPYSLTYALTPFYLSMRPDELYQAWVLNFELVK